MQNNFDLAKMFFEKGEVNYANKDYVNAENNFQTSLNFLPNHIPSLINLGLTKIKLRKIKDCKEIIQKIDFNNNEENNLDILNLKSLFYGASNSFEECINIIDQILSHSKNLDKKKISKLYSFKGVAYSQLGDHKKSITYQKKAIELNKNNFSAHFALGCRYLKTGNFKDGWRRYEYRLKENSLDDSKYPTNITDIKNKNILIKFEQGFGDIIQFSRFINLIENYTKKIDFLIPKKLKNLFNFKYTQLIFKKENKYDYEIYLCSLPYLLKIDYDDLLNTPYDNFKLIKKNQKLFNSKSKINIGLAWSGNYSYKFDYLRSINLKDLKPLFDNSRINLVCLQKDIRENDMEFLNKSNIKNLGNMSFSEISEEIIKLDLVISSCTSLLHLASSLRTETWAMLPYSSDWRWLDKKSYSPWYKDLKIYQKTKHQTWTELARLLNGDLSEKFN